MCSPSLTSLLPQELIDQIIDDNELDMSTLISCSVVCRSFVRPSQARIFTHLDCGMGATDRTNVARFRRLHDVLTESPRLVPYITNLSFRQLYPWNTPNELLSILRLLSNVRSINFERIYWSRLPSDVRIAIRDLCQRSKLSHLGLKEVQNMSAECLALIADTPNLTHLSLPDVELSASEDIARWPLQKRIQLFDLVLHKIDDNVIDMIVSWLVEGRCLSGLRRLSFNWHARATSSFQRLIGVSASSLEDVTISSSFLLSQPPRILSLAAATALRSISVTVMICTESFIPWLVELLQSHNSPRTLYTIILNIVTTRLAVPDDWDKLARLLEGDRFPALRTVEFIFSKSSSPLLPAIVTAAETAFVRLVARGVFKCSKRT
ncbi:hypothetical protein MVEN_01732300 [Mycena venus]|uniref:Uncharacterized protein n=1 Tax=Mycena venus TaxID=2733690 RepID=A0A8H6XM53_9AGAR|nr:hypothetical protein MVEN_01732300 [Mycena venus]